MAALRMNDIYQHTPVLLSETVDNLITTPDGVYVDATFGRGSHTQAILQRLSAAGHVIAFDKDPEAIAYAKQSFAHEKRFKIFHASFAKLESILQELKLVGKVNGVLFDLGVSSPQLDNPVRGFSFSNSGQLDMRMDTTQGIDAATFIASVEEKTLADVLYHYGEEKHSRRIARAIVQAREMNPITTTAQLAEIILRAVPKHKKTFEKHPATRCFQAIRIVVNQELKDLELGLAQALTVLNVGGRIAAISFHSLEDRIVKHFIRENEKGQEAPRGLPVKANAIDFNAKLKSCGKPIKPTTQELNLNPRSRSAILRIAEKLS